MSPESPTIALAKARRRAARQTPATPALPCEPLAVDATTAAALCGVGRATWWKWTISGRCPAPIRLGRCCLWRVDDLRAWLAQGCPPRDRLALAEYRTAKAAELAALKGGEHE